MYIYVWVCLCVDIYVNIYCNRNK